LGDDLEVQLSLSLDLESLDPESPDPEVGLGPGDHQEIDSVELPNHHPIVRIVQSDSQRPHRERKRRRDDDEYVLIQSLLIQR
jgi:hypothetical protein